jgi:uncharacterized protein YraI
MPTGAAASVLLVRREPGARRASLAVVAGLQEEERMFRNSLRALALAIGLLTPGVAAAAVSAVVTTDLNIRTGPGAKYQRFGTIPGGYQVTVYGCLTGYNWCDVNWAGTRGWVSGKYLAYVGRQYRPYYRRPVASIGISIGLPVIGFDPYHYHRRYYRDKPWYRDRYLDRDRRRCFLPERYLCR